MYVVRPVKLKDLDALEKCATSIGLGVINIPKDRNTLKQRILSSISSFSSKVAKPSQEDYLFVLSNIDDGSIGGTSGIYAEVGESHPLIVFRIEQLNPRPKPYPKPSETRILYPMSYQAGPSELCALYLSPNLRQEGYGKLLSLSRLLFIAAHPQRFNETIVANMRGVIENKESPFWEGLGKHLIPLSFEEIMNLRATGDETVCDIITKHPIYVSLLSAQTRSVIGQVHPNTIPALKMLQKEGFIFNNEIDPVDGGPIIAASTEDLRTVKKSIVKIVEKITTSPIESERYIISNDKEDFRACYGMLNVQENGKVIIHASTAKLLEIQPGDRIRYI